MANRMKRSSGVGALEKKRQENKYESSSSYKTRRLLIELRSMSRASRYAEESPPVLFDFPSIFLLIP